MARSSRSDQDFIYISSMVVILAGILLLAGILGPFIPQTSAQKGNHSDRVPRHHHAPDRTGPSPPSPDDGSFGGSFQTPYNAVLTFSFQRVEILDPIDAFDDDGELFFDIWINDEEFIEDNDGNYWVCTIGVPYDLNLNFSYSVHATEREVNIEIALVDADLAFDDLVDIDGTSQYSKTIHLAVDLSMAAGSSLNAQADGSLDGTQSSDDDDGLLSYSISVLPSLGT